MQRLILSRRNLLALLHKLEMPGSARTIEKQGVLVSVEPDEDHYAGREPGPMHPDTEAFVADIERFLAGRKRPPTSMLEGRFLNQRLSCDGCKGNCHICEHGGP